MGLTLASLPILGGVRVYWTKVNCAVDNQNRTILCRARGTTRFGSARRWLRRITKRRVGSAARHNKRDHVFSYHPVQRKEAVSGPSSRYLFSSRVVGRLRPSSDQLCAVTPARKSGDLAVIPRPPTSTHILGWKLQQARAYLFGCFP